MRHLPRCTPFYSLVIGLLLSLAPAKAQVTGLSFRPVDAAYSLALDRIILISASPNQLHIYNPVTQADQIVFLSAPPQNISLSPDGLHAAVLLGNSAPPYSVVYVDLQAALLSRIRFRICLRGNPHKPYQWSSAAPDTFTYSLAM